MAISTVPIPYIDAAGFHMPLYEDVKAAHRSDYESVYGSDISWDNSNQDTELVDIESTAFMDFYNVALSVYNSFAPSTAQGTGLSSVVKVNGITRDIASYSTQTVTIVGQVGTLLTNQTVGDGTQAWALPPTVVIPFSGTIDVTATCTVLGAIIVDQGTEGVILQPTRGLQQMVFSGVTAPGQPDETDPQLKVRREQSTTLPARGIVDGIQGALLALPNVNTARVYENDGTGPSGNAPDANGIPAHCISAVVDGGDSEDIAMTIAIRKLSSGTYGTSSAIAVTGVANIQRQINFFYASKPQISVLVTVKALRGYTTDVQSQIKSEIAAYINGLGIGDGLLGAIDVGRLYGPALLNDTNMANTFTIKSIQVSRDGNTPGPGPVPIAFNEEPQTNASLITVVPS